jgi:pimeloyl-ACP methyl ester carboxylesterase
MWLATVGKGASMDETKISPVIDGVQIPGILVTPQHPVASLLLIPGSLNSDVDGNYAPMFPGQPGVAPHAYKDLAFQLAAHGIAVLRFAKTGPGTGSVVIDKEGAPERYKLFSQRVRVAEVFLSELRRMVPGVPCIVAGHSEGAVAAMLLTQSHKEVRGIVTLSGPAQPLLHMMLKQQFQSDQRDGKITPEVERQYAAALSMLNGFVASRPLPEGYEANPYAAFFSFAVRPENAPYLRSLESIDPAAEFGKTLQPALIIQGGRDGSVAPENAELLHRVKPDSQLKFFPELQHFYKRVPDGLSPQISFAQGSECDPLVARTISSWIVTLPDPKP